MKRRLLAILMAAVMTASLAACGSSETATSESSAAPAQESAAAEESAASSDDAAASTEAAEGTEAAAVDPDDPWAGWADVDTSEHVVITYMTTGDAPSGDKAATVDAMLEKLNAILTEKVNAELEIYYIGWTDQLANYNRTLARMDGSVDLVGTASDWLDAWPNSKNGAFLELSEEMLQTYAPATWASVTPEHWDLCKYNGNIYLMPEDNYAQWTNHGFIYRLDWAKEAGLENGVHSWEDMTEYFRYVKEAYPDIIPWDSDGNAHMTLAGGWVSSHSDFVSIDGLSNGALWGGTREDLYTVVTPAYTDTEMMVEFAELMKEWDTIGVWPTDVLNNKATTNRDDYRIGRVAAEQHHTQTWTDLVSHTTNNTIYQDDPDAESGFFWFGEETGNVTALNITHGAMAVSAGSANPERALMVYDLLRNDPDCYHLLCYGEQGVSWDVNEEGLRITPEGYNADTQDVGNTTNFWWGRNDDLEIRSADRDWDKIDAMYAELESNAIQYPYGQFVPEIDAIQGQINNVNETYGNYMKQIAYGKYNGTAEEIVAEMQAALKQAGIEEVTAELQRQITELYGAQ